MFLVVHDSIHTLILCHNTLAHLPPVFIINICKTTYTLEDENHNTSLLHNTTYMYKLVGFKLNMHFASLLVTLCVCVCVALSLATVLLHFLNPNLNLT